MSPHDVVPLRPTVGVIGFGAFGRLIARHLAPHARVRAYDPALPAAAFAESGAVRASLEAAARCSIVILAVPVSGLAEAVASVAPHLRPGTLVVDVGSVKVNPVAILRAHLPAHVEILATHPLFGPQSARGGIRGLKIAVCPVRGRRGLRVAAFLRRTLGLEVVVTSPEAHDREMAAIQGLTHLIAKVLVRMEPLPTRMTTRSFEHLMRAVEMVRHDAPGVFEAIEHANPYAADVRRRFFAVAGAVERELADDRPPSAGATPGTRGCGGARHREARA